MPAILLGWADRLGTLVSPWSLVILATCSAAGAVSFLIAFWLRDLHLAKVVLQDAHTCPNCGYNLTGLPSPRCPECGHHIEDDELRTVHNARRQWAKTGWFCCIAGTVLLGAYLCFPFVVVHYAFDSSTMLTARTSAALYFLDWNPWCANRAMVGYLDHESVLKRTAATFPYNYRPCLRFRGRFEPPLRADYPRGYWVGLPDSVATRLKRAAFDDPDKTVRMQAASVLALYSVDSIRATLPSWLAREDAGSRWMVLGIMSNYWMHPNYRCAIPFLIEALTDEDVEVRASVYLRLLEITRAPTTRGTPVRVDQELQYDPTAAPDDLAAARDRWRAWWRAHEIEVMTAAPIDPNAVTLDRFGVLRRW